MKTCKICGGKHLAKGLCSKHYRQLPEVKARQREYNRKYYQKPEVREKKKEYLRKYNQKPENREKHKLKKTITEYHTLLKKKKPSRTEILRLEALADILGRDIEEWRTERMRKDYHERMDFSQRFEKRSG